MEPTKIIIISIASFMVLVLLTIIFIIIYRNSFKNNNSKYEKIISTQLDKINIKQVEGLLKRIDVIANSNPDYRNTLSILEGFYDKIIKKRANIIKDSERILLSIKERKGFKKAKILEYLKDFKERG